MFVSIYRVLIGHKVILVNAKRLLSLLISRHRSIGARVQCWYARLAGERSLVLNARIAKRLLPIALILLCGLAVLAWFRGEGYIYFWDEVFPFNPQINSYLTSFVWSRQDGTGEPLPGNPTNLTWFFLVRFLNIFLSLQHVQVVIFYLLFACSGLGMYWFVMDANGKRQLPALASALLYMFNMYVVGMFIPFLAYFFIMPSLPLMILILRKGYQASRKATLNALPFVFLFQVPVLLSTPALTSLLPEVVLFVLFYFAFLMSQSAPNRRELLQSAKFLLLLVPFSVLLNLWWLLPRLVVGNPLATIGIQYSNVLSSNLQGGVYSTLTVMNVLRLLGTVGFRQVYPYPTFWWTNLYNTGVFEALGLLFPLLAVLPFLSARRIKSDKHLAFFGFVFLFYLVLIAGMGTFPSLFLYIYDHVPTILPFIVDPYLASGFMLVLTYCYLFGTGIEALFKALENWNW